MKTNDYYYYLISKFGDYSRGRPEGSLFLSYNTKVKGRALLHSLACSNTFDPYLKCWVLSKEASSTIFWVFGMTRPGIEPQSPGSLVNTPLLNRKLSLHTNFSNNNSYLNCLQIISWFQVIGDMITWDHIITSQLLVLRIVNWSYNCFQIIIITNYLKPYNCLKNMG